MQLAQHTITRGIMLLALLLLTGPSSYGTITRTISDDPYFPLVELTLQPAPGTGAYAIEETLAPGALPTAIDNNGYYDSATHKIKWGPFLGEDAHTFSYRITGEEGTKTVSATASYDGTLVGPDDDRVILPDPQTTYIGSHYLNTDTREFTRFEFDPDHDADRNGRSDLMEYAFPLSEEILETLNLITIEGIASGYTVRALYRANTLDVEFFMEGSDDLLFWQPLTTQFPSVTITRQDYPDIPGIEEITYDLQASGINIPRFIRLKGEWISDQ